LSWRGQSQLTSEGSKENMEFQVLPYRAHIPDLPISSKIAYLMADNWNDYGYVTQYRLAIRNERGVLHDIGMLKIGQKLMDEDQLSPQLPPRFTALDHDYFSLGQDELYYSNLRNFSPRETPEKLSVTLLSTMIFSKMC
jgi:hypothetical protein